MDGGRLDGAVLDIAEHVRRFSGRGGHVECPPHAHDRRLLWVAQARSALDRYYDEQHVRRSDRLELGLLYLWYAVRKPLCMVAMQAGEVVAALNYVLEDDGLHVGYLGSRQAAQASGWCGGEAVNRRPMSDDDLLARMRSLQVAGDRGEVPWVDETAEGTALWARMHRPVRLVAVLDVTMGRSSAAPRVTSHRGTSPTYWTGVS